MPTVSNLSTYHPTIAHRRWNLTSEDRGRSKASPRGNCSGQSGTAAGFPPISSNSGFHLAVLFHQCYIILFYSPPTDAINRVFKENVTVYLNKCKGKDHPITALEGPEGE
jgi:hypothetical protein